jgi:5'-nucleotidase
MNILLTNDDGIHAPGLWALYQTLKTDHHLTVVAPETQMSAVGHSITLVEPIRVRPIRKNGGFFGYALSGTPADCARIGALELAEKKPDLVLSGINHGANVGINVLYSGTVSAANEAAIIGLGAVAVSLAGRGPDLDYGYAAGFVWRLLEQWTNLGLAPGLSLNINVPNLPPDQIQPPVWARQSLIPAGETFSRRVDPRGNVYYWRGVEIPPEALDPDSDWALLAQGHVTLTPLRHDLTHHTELARLRRLHIEP